MRTKLLQSMAHQKRVAMVMMLPKKKTEQPSLGHLDKKGNFIYHIGDTIGLRLPDGTELRVGDRSTEARLIRFLTDPDSHVDTVNKSRGWITCDRIYFESGSDHLTAESKTQVVYITEILLAFPHAQIKVGGYSDNTGDSVANQSLSDARAAAVLKALHAGGANNAVSAKGYGSNWPIASNAYDEGKAMNRRVDIRVIKK